ncbi:sensor histidine kinase [Larkinella soli]|uniref:sensor histidine kinase n=1 Tax=Larkinella soli TaxID=1770527 RepID=UPI000FFC773C|nr:histidine kinase [Larkinella soli]
MKPFRDTRLRIFGPIVLMLFGSLFFRLKFIISFTPGHLLQYLLVSITSGYICWNLTRWVVRRIQRRYPDLVQTRRRLFLLALAFPVLVNIGYFLRYFGHEWLSPLLNNPKPAREDPFILDYIETVGVQIFYHFIYIGIYEGVYIFLQWQQTTTEKQELLRTLWQGKFEVLKNQVNPHFLFNSLNTLSSLISENPAQAEEFVDDMASVYRYLLQSNERELTSLRTELAFIQSYFYLLKTRYGEGLFLNLEVDDRSMDTLIPPLTLQMLVENAVKHNVILPEQPLQIDIAAREGTLQVRNTLQRKHLRVESSHMGLSNIAAKYRLLSQPDPKIEEKEGAFVVTLPLIQERVAAL